MDRLQTIVRYPLCLAAFLSLCLLGGCAAGDGGASDPSGGAEPDAPSEQSSGSPSEADDEADPASSEDEAPEVVLREVPEEAYISCEELLDMVSSGKTMQIVDLRPFRQFTVAHIKGALGIPAGKQLEIRLDEIPRDRLIVLVDDKGRTTEASWNTLVSYGFAESDVLVLREGMATWITLGYPTDGTIAPHC